MRTYTYFQGLINLKQQSLFSSRKAWCSLGDVFYRSLLRQLPLLLLMAYILSSILIPPTASASEPSELHTSNPHYFLFRGSPTVLITSGEHYGAVLNLDFDYIRYLDELQSNGLNLNLKSGQALPILNFQGPLRFSKTHSHPSQIASAAFGSAVQLVGLPAEGTGLI